mmetsp:Transcript_42399/g.70285  ORF Transcript_42399/g.70285 Transcript_42399/m.70285 type:complete len:84 (-) Transcript_42399:878-1129(-)
MPGKRDERQSGITHKLEDLSIDEVFPIFVAPHNVSQNFSGLFLSCLLCEVQREMPSVTPGTEIRHGNQQLQNLPARPDASRSM